MGLAHSPSVVTNGLVFYYDMNNRIKSWRGRPVTNQYALPTADVNGFSVQNSTFTRVRSGNFGGYDIQPSDYVWRYNISSNDCPYHGNDVTINAGQTAVFSFDYFVDPTTTNYPVTNYLANFEGVTSNSVGDPTPSIKGVWKRAVFTATAGSTGLCRMLLYPGACGGRLGDSGFILYRNPQVEFDAPGNNPSPFVAGTRSDTQAIYDLTGNNTITATSLTYASDGTFSFNAASSNYIDSGYDLSWNNTNSASIEFWCKPSNTSQTVGIVGKGSDWEWQARQTGDGLQFVYWNTGGSHSNGPIPTVSGVFSTNVWKHITIVWSHTSNQLYLFANGILISTSNWTDASINANKSNTVKIGGLIYDWGGGSYWSGSIGSVKFYSNALSGQEVLQNFNAQRGLYGV